MSAGGPGRPPDDLFEPDSPEAEAMHEWTNGATARKRRERDRPKRMTNYKFRCAVEQAKAFAKAGNWEDATAKHFVALYAWMHQEVYGVEAVELDPERRMKAAGLAHNFLLNHFGEDPTALVKYMRWLWVREKGREKWRRENGGSGGRLTWYQQFTPGQALTDYRLDEARRGKEGGA